jgi:hypothetical protein
MTRIAEKSEWRNRDAHNFSDAGKWCTVSVVSVASPPVHHSQQDDE